MSQVGYGAGDLIGTPFDLYIPLTAFNITPQTSMCILKPAGTLATGTFNLPANPPDGARIKLMSTQTQTALTVAAATGDTIGGSAVTALVANTPVEWAYSLNGAIGTAGTGAKTWYRLA